MGWNRCIIHSPMYVAPEERKHQGQAVVGLRGRSLRIAANMSAGTKGEQNRSPSTSEKMRIRTIATNTFDSQAYAQTHYVQTGADVPHILHMPLRNPLLFHFVTDWKFQLFRVSGFGAWIPNGQIHKGLRTCLVSLRVSNKHDNLPVSSPSRKLSHTRVAR